MRKTPKTGVTVIITKSVGDGWLCDAYGPTGGGALAHQYPTPHPTIEAAASEAHDLYGDAIVDIRVWSPDSGYRTLDTAS